MSSSNFSFKVCVLLIVSSMALGSFGCKKDKGRFPFFLLLSGENTVSGTAAVGKPIIGVIYIKDSAGKTVQGRTDSTGRFSISVAGLKGPFIIMAEGKVKGYGPVIRLFSALQDPGTVNSTPVTDALVALAVRDLPCNVISPSDMKSDGVVTSLPADFQERFSKSKDAFGRILEPVVDHGFDIVNGSFSADGTGFDKVLDTVHVKVNGVTGRVTLGLRDKNLSGAEISLNADVSNQSEYQGAINAVENNAAFIKQPEFRMKYMISVSSPGADGVWFTGDDAASVGEMSFYPSGRSWRQYSHSGAGPDGQLLPTDAYPDALIDNIRTLMGESTDEDNPTVTIGTTKILFEVERGTIGSFEWEHVLVYDVTLPATKVFTQYTSTIFDPATREVQSMALSKWGVDPRGPDGILFTDDDLLDMYGKKDSARNLAVLYSNPGPDGNWMTTGDNVISGYCPISTYEAGKTVNGFAYTGKGADNQWFTEDDTMSMYMKIIFEPVL